MPRCAPLLYRKRQLLAKAETTCGVAQVLVAADGACRVNVSPVVEVNAAIVDREIARASLSSLAGAVGERTASVKFSHELVGSGIAANPPECDVFLRGCMMQKIIVSKISIGAITGGSFKRGETVTQATSLATGRVLIPAKTGDSALYIEVVSGAFNATAVITGGSSAATATASSLATAAGFAYRPKSSSPETLTIRSEEDGFQKTVVGAMGTFSISCDSAGYGKIEFDFSGALGSSGDLAMTTGIVSPVTTPPILLGANLKLNANEASEYAPIFRSVGIDLGNNVALRKDGNAASGVIASLVTGRSPKATLSPEMMLASEYDIFGKMFSASAITMGFKLGSDLNNTIYIFADEAQIEGLGDAEMDSVSGLDVTLRLNSAKGDSELELVFV